MLGYAVLILQSISPFLFFRSTATETKSSALATAFVSSTEAGGFIGSIGLRSSQSQLCLLLG